MIGPISRIIGRYIAAAAVTYGVLSPGDAELLHPEFIAIAGGVLGVAIETVYGFAKRKGWVT